MGKYSTWDDRDCSTRKNCYRCHNWVSEHKACGGCYVVVEPQHVNAQICKDIETALLKLDTLNTDYNQLSEIKMGNCTRFIMDQWKHGFMEFGDNDFEVWVDASETNDLLANIVCSCYSFYGTNEDWCEHVDFSQIIDKVITPKVIKRIKEAAIEEQEMCNEIDSVEPSNKSPITLRKENMPASLAARSRKPDLKIVR